MIFLAENVEIAMGGTLAFSAWVDDIESTSISSHSRLRFLVVRLNWGILSGRVPSDFQLVQVDDEMLTAFLWFCVNSITATDMRSYKEHRFQLVTITFIGYDSTWSSATSMSVGTVDNNNDDDDNDS